MRSSLIFIFILLLLSGCKNSSPASIDTVTIKARVNQVMDKWHEDVAKADFDAYFDAMTEDAVFIGTDASENWSKKEFMAFAKPFFQKKKTWVFKPLKRNVFVGKDGEVVWFDELLDTWMNICRGSGVLVKKGETWKIKHYVLSVTIPNDSMNTVVGIKALSDSLFISRIR